MLRYGMSTNRRERIERDEVTQECIIACLSMNPVKKKALGLEKNFALKLFNASSCLLSGGMMTMMMIIIVIKRETE